ncbi:MULTISPECIES: YodC family protein [Pseudomonas aeruginosa group]|uniref:YodC family protein n=1 Tax=Pseudomonas aeruginosa group TaxID=136841 RepID=UPI001A210F25|nr:YodC family protein [Pseudomonas aeruginosa]MBI8696029.1 DUF2158 domain-containing protein [Pseudomonas aeruginosa]MCS8245256.1 YodC family protein [Pseudomonas aeruginosa]MDU0780954.1 YodC family protein [Pseudomonas aeruginosa]UYT20259.1 hypothetical protein OBG92_02416 [Pseudomonas aeruginosa]WBJ42243.1 hypothetical protein PALA42_03939 [Pseudomonas aeruginosa]
MSDIKIGDVVQLKSGGPAMTVQDIGDYSSRGIDHGAHCVWFDHKDAPQQGVYAIAALKPVD